VQKILLTIAVTAILIVFGLQNSDHVPISFIVGSPIQIRLVFLLIIAAACGFLYSYIRGLRREISLKRQLRKLAGMKLATLDKLPDMRGEHGTDA
jgi:uncharacterized integral membrane protein